MTSVQRLSAAVAGLGLLIMAILAGYATFGIIGQAAQATDGRLNLAAWAMGIVAVLDVLVGLGTWGLLRADARRSAAASAVLRCAYAALLAVAVYRLAVTTGTGIDRARAFQSVFAPSLALFGVHLVVLAWPIAVTRFAHPLFRRTLAVAVALCGVGYFIDAVSPWLLARTTSIASVTFVGEIVLIFWFLVLAVRGR